MAHPTLYFIRHGQTDWNAEYRLQGQRDIPLNDTGRAQAQKNGETLRGLINDPAHFSYISSPMSRTRETMNIVRRTLGMPLADYSVDDRLKEISYGDWEGFTYDELRQTVPDQVEARLASKWDYQLPRGESYEMLLNRVKAWLPYVENDSVVVCHGGIIRVLMHHLEGVSQDEVVQFSVPQDRIYKWNGVTAEWI